MKAQNQRSKELITFSTGNQNTLKFLGSDAEDPFVKNSLNAVSRDIAHFVLDIKSNLNLVYEGTLAKNSVRFKVGFSTSSLIFEFLCDTPDFKNNSICASYFSPAPGKFTELFETFHRTIFVYKKDNIGK